MMVDIKSISAGLQLADDGIWYSIENENLSYPAEGNDTCFEIEDNSFWFRHRNNCIASIVKTYPPEDGGSIFDIGGGNGFVSLGLENAGFDAVLIEPGRTGASNAKVRGVSNVICATTKAAGLRKKSLPAVGLFDVIEHIEDDTSFLGSVRELMKKNARLYVTVPAYSFLWSNEDVVAGHFRRYDLTGITNVLKAAGFEINFASYFFRFLPIPIFLLRTLPYKLRLSKPQIVSNAASRDHATKRGAKAKILDRILASETKNLDNSKPMSFGGSCLVVATRP